MIRQMETKMKDTNELLSYMLHKRTKNLSDKMKVIILDKLIELSEARNGMLFKEELQVIRAGVEAERNKEKEKDLKSITSVVENLIGRFDSNEEFDNKVDKK